MKDRMKKCRNSKTECAEKCRKQKNKNKVQKQKINMCKMSRMQNTNVEFKVEAKTKLCQ